MDALIPTNQPAPDFTLADLNGGKHSLSSYRGRVVVLNFWSAECPHAERSDEELTELLKGWGEEVLLLPVASNVNEPAELLRRVASERGLSVILHDPGAEVADLYGGQTTPHIFVIDREGILRYQGAFDDMTFRQRKPTHNYLKQAVEAVLEGKAPNPAEVRPYGCAVVRYAA